MTFARPDKETARAQMQRLVARYQQQSGQVEVAGSTYPESQARLDFIDDFFKIFGWDIRNEDGLPQSDREVAVEQYIDLADDDSSGRPDYTFRHGRQPRLVVEAKRPAVAIRLRNSPALQARTYGWSLSVPAAILTNFADTIFFDATVAPDVSDGPDTAAMPGLSFHYTDYVDRFDQLWARLSHDVLTSDQFYSTYSYEEPPRGASAFDRAFLEQFRRWRLQLASDIARNNATISATEVGRRTQRLLNAMLFLRICEDRRIEVYRELLSSAETNRLMERFAQADAAYNAGLFSLLASTGVSDQALLTVVRQMYWPVSKYAFGVLQPEVLAGIYEQFLAERVVVNGSQVSLERKPEVTHAAGIVPTPLYIVDTLVERGLGIKLLTHDWSSGQNLRLLDMSQGSGIFLLAAFRVLVNDYEAKHDVCAIEERARIAREHLYGVDIDAEAVEVARLSLLLAVLGDALIDPLTARSALPDLSKNLLVGNSLIDHTFDEVLQVAAQDPQRRAAVHPFDWAGNFPGLAGPDGDGFDVVFGNPPYVRIQELALHFPDQLAAFQSPAFGYVSARQSFDLYMLFVERALSLLNEQGRLALIVPQRFTSLPVAGPLRRLLSPVIEELVHFGQEQVFLGRTTYTALLVCARQAESEVLVEVVDDLASWRSGSAGHVRVLQRSTLTAAPWPLSSEAATVVFGRMRESARRTVADVAKIFVGVQTSKDRLFFLKVDGEDGDLYRFRDVNDREWRIEKGLVRPALLDAKLIPYDAEPEPDRHVIWPYGLDDDGRPSKVPIAPEEMRDLYPRGWEYLSHHRAALLDRNVRPNPLDAFYAFGRDQSLTVLSEPKVIIRGMSITPQYAWDTRGLVAAGGGTGGPYYLMRPLSDSDVPYQALVAVLSHPAVEALLASTAPVNRGGYVTHRKAEMQHLPIPEFDPPLLAEVVGLVDELHQTASRMRTLRDPDLLQTATERRVWVRARIDGLVARAFDMTAEDMEALAP